MVCHKCHYTTHDKNGTYFCNECLPKVVKQAIVRTVLITAVIVFCIGIFVGSIIQHILMP